MNLPNVLTLIRIFLVPLLVAAVVQQRMRLVVGGHTVVANDFFALAVFWLPRSLICWTDILRAA